MKEYIAKDDIRNIVKYKMIGGEELKGLPTVTKADICREFADKIFERFGHGKSLHDVIVEVLAEMESENEHKYSSYTGNN